MRRFAVSAVGRAPGEAPGSTVIFHRLNVVFAGTEEQAEQRGRADFASHHEDGTVLSCLIEEIAS